MKFISPKTDFAFKKIWLDRLEPAEELVVVFRIFLREIRPLPAKILSRRGLVVLDLAQVNKPRHTANDLVFERAFLTRKHAFHDLVPVVLRGIRQQNITAAFRARQKV